MMKAGKELLEDLDNQSRQVSVKELQTMTLHHQDTIDRMNKNLSSMLKKYSQPVITKAELEQEGRSEYLKQNSDISQLESLIAKESKEYMVALKEHIVKPAPKFYEIWKKKTMDHEAHRLSQWRESIRSMNEKLATEKELYLETPSAKIFVAHYSKEKIVEQENNQKRVQDINLKRASLSEQRKEIAKINFSASQIKNRDTNITVNGNLKDLNHVAFQGEKIKNQLLKIQLNESSFAKTRGAERCYALYPV